jgi:uncharacterized protein YndB with AHSA1/START domain
MRFSDGPSVDVEVLVAAPPERVWDVATDLASLGDPGAEYQGGEWVDGTGPELGARLRGRNKREDFAWETTSVITEFEPPRSFEWAVGDPSNASATWRFDLTPEGDGTRLRQSVVMGPGPSGLTMAIDRMPDKEERIIERRLEEHRANMTRTIEGIKALAETRP